MFKAMLDDVATGTSLRITIGGETVWETTRPETAPKASRARASLTKDDNVRISWSASCHGESESAWVRWSDDGGETWHALTVGLTGKAFEFPLDQSPTGSVVFQVLVHDGFTTVEATAAPLEIPDQPPAVTILYPGDIDLVYNERQIHLWGAANTRARNSFDADSLVWYIDDAEVGRGADIWVDNPGVGQHRLELRVDGSDAGTGMAQTTFEVLE
jgi:predicted small integral membrane protein